MGDFLFRSTVGEEGLDPSNSRDRHWWFIVEICEAHGCSDNAKLTLFFSTTARLLLVSLSIFLSCGLATILLVFVSSPFLNILYNTSINQQPQPDF